MPNVSNGLFFVRDIWLSEVLARETYRVGGTLAQDKQIQERRDLKDMTDQADFCYARVPTHELKTCEMLEQGGFRIVDVGVTLELGALVGRSRPAERVRLARPDDCTTVEQIARDSFRYSRFHLDPYLPRELADEIKAQWARNFFLGKRGDAMVVAERAGEIAGFLQLLRAPEEMLVIDLIAVTERHRGCGLAEEMVRYVAHTDEQCKAIRVGTQIANVASLALYQKIGFRIISSSYLFHYHKTSC